MLLLMQAKVIKPIASVKTYPPLIYNYQTKKEFPKWFKDMLREEKLKNRTRS